MRRRGHVLLGLCATSLALASSAPARAQTAQVATDRGPHYVGDPATLQLTVRGLDESPLPEVEASQPTSGRLELLGVNPNVSQSITIVGGRMTRTQEVTHVFEFRVTADRPGDLTIGPFLVSQGDRELSARAVTMRFREVPSSNEISLRVQLPSGPIFIGERVPVRVEFTLARRLQENLVNYTLSVPLFDLEQSFRFLDEEPTGAATKVTFQTASGPLELEGVAREVERAGQTTTLVSVTRTLIPLVSGEHRLPAARIDVDEGVRFQRDFFGGRKATRVRRWRASDDSRLLVVQDIPRRGSPPSFGGAIGTGFTLEVAADRTVVRVGDPVTLTLSLHGEGLETASLPPLDAEGLLPAESFRVPSGEVAGELSGDTKRFRVTVRVLDEGVQEIPPLAYSWFDPSTGAYETTRSRPIALSVRSADVIDASDVERSHEAAGAQTALEPSGEEPESVFDGPRSTTGRVLARTGADLAIERDLALLMSGSGEHAVAERWSVALVAVSLLLVLFSLLDRRRRRVDPVRARSRKIVATERARILELAERPTVDAAEKLARALRCMLAEVPHAASSELDAFLGECDAQSYAPKASSRAVDPAFFERALQLADAISERLR